MTKKLPDPPKTWEEFENLREYLTDCDVSFLRKKEDQDRYKSYETSIDRDTMLENIYEQMGGEDTALLENRFPHTNVLSNFAEALHFCLWSKKGVLSDSEIENHVKKRFPKKRWFSMTRKNGFFSIPEIWHCHIYIKD